MAEGTAPVFRSPATEASRRWSWYVCRLRWCFAIYCAVSTAKRLQSPKRFAIQRWACPGNLRDERDFEVSLVSRDLNSKYTCLRTCIVRLVTLSYLVLTQPALNCVEFYLKKRAFFFSIVNWHIHYMLLAWCDLFCRWLFYAFLCTWRCSLIITAQMIAFLFYFSYVLSLIFQCSGRHSCSERHLWTLA